MPASRTLVALVFAMGLSSTALAEEVSPSAAVPPPPVPAGVTASGTVITPAGEKPAMPILEPGMQKARDGNCHHAKEETVYLTN
jgi:hypothetical protein